LPGRIGPHEGREIALLLAGSKRIAWFGDIEFAPEDEAAPLVASGQLKRELWLSEHGTTGVVYFVPGAEDEVAELKTLTVDWLDSGVDADVADVRVGQLLGYSADDIAAHQARKREWEASPEGQRVMRLLHGTKGKLS
jgi:hypothetical protein